MIKIKIIVAMVTKRMVIMISANYAIFQIKNGEKKTGDEPCGVLGVARAPFLEGGGVALVIK